MEVQDTTNITVLIGGRPYPLKIKVSDEAAIRVLVKEINERFNRLQQTYTKKDKQDILAMLLLTYAVDMYKTKLQATDNTVSEQLAQLDDLLSQMLNH